LRLNRLEIAAAFCCDEEVKRLFPAIYALSCLIAAHSFAGSGTWSAAPVNSNWNNPANWTPNTVPNGPNDVATFEASNETEVIISSSTEVNELVFSPGASAFTINVSQEQTFTISGTGITNRSGLSQNLVIEKTSHLDLTNSATVGELTFFTLLGGTGSFGGGGLIFFSDTSSAGDGTFVVNGAADDFGNGAAIGFSGSASSGNGTFTVKGGGTAIIFFIGTSTAGNASFVIEGGNGSGSVAFFGSDLEKPTAGNAIFNVNGGTTPGASGGFVQFSGGTAGSATFITNPGRNGGFSGYIRYLANDESEAQMKLFGGSLSAEYAGGEATVAVGSIEGTARIALSAIGAQQKFITGSNDLSTAFSGTITDSGGAFGSTGALVKVGNGTLTLGGSRSYIGGTTIEGGMLVINNRTGSGTGTGPIQVNAGRLGGRGIIGGAVVVGTGTGPGAALTPGQYQGRQNTLTIQGPLTFNSDGYYVCGVNSKSGVSDEVVANGVTINGGQFVLREPRGFSLTPGTMLTVVSNTSADAISGTFANLPDNSIFKVGPNRYQANYSGGDGNDLTLTVVP
jgi:autotransporter-associated beta strand protein